MVASAAPNYSAASSTNTSKQPDLAETNGLVTIGTGVFTRDTLRPGVPMRFEPQPTDPPLHVVYEDARNAKP